MYQKLFNHSNDLSQPENYKLSGQSIHKRRDYSGQNELEEKKHIVDLFAFFKV